MDIQFPALKLILTLIDVRVTCPSESRGICVVIQFHSPSECRCIRFFCSLMMQLCRRRAEAGLHACRHPLVILIAFHCRLRTALGFQTATTCGVCFAERLTRILSRRMRTNAIWQVSISCHNRKKKKKRKKAAVWGEWNDWLTDLTLLRKDNLQNLQISPIIPDTRCF